MRTRIKICGITRPEDALVAVEAGADAIGLIVYEPSPRCVTLEQAGLIRNVVPAFVSLVLVTVNLGENEHQRWIDTVNPDLLQFHGEEPPTLCERFRMPYIKSLRMRNHVDPNVFSRQYGGARAILMDTFVDGVVGGTGRQFDWTLARNCGSLPVVLAGGLKVGNVAEAIRVASPFALDVSSSLERSPGAKDHCLVRNFISAVRDADANRDRETGQAKI